MRYRVDYEVVGNAIHFRATFDERRPRARGRVRFRSLAASTPRPRSTPSCRTTSRSPTGTSRPERAAPARVQPLLPAQRPDQVERVVAARLRAQREALGDAVDELPAAGGRVEAALVADVPALRDLLAEADDRVLDVALRSAGAPRPRRGRALASAGRSRPALRPRAGRARRCCSSAVSAPPARLAGAAEHEPAQLVDVGHVGLGEQADARVERRAGDRHADAHVEVRAASPRCRGAGSRPAPAKVSTPRSMPSFWP